MSSLRRGHANLLCIVPILVYVCTAEASNNLVPKMASDNNSIFINARTVPNHKIKVTVKEK